MRDQAAEKVLVSALSVGNEPPPNNSMGLPSPRFALYTLQGTTGANLEAADDGDRVKTR